MKIRNVVTFALACCLCTSIANADDSVVGKIQMIQPYLPQNMVFVHLKGYPLLNGGSCPSSFFAGRMDDANFKTFVYSMLLTAKASDADIKLSVQGCYGAYPIIVGLEYSPRQ